MSIRIERMTRKNSSMITQLRLILNHTNISLRNFKLKLMCCSTEKIQGSQKDFRAKDKYRFKNSRQSFWDQDFSEGNSIEWNLKDNYCVIWRGFYE